MLDGELSRTRVMGCVHARVCLLLAVTSIVTACHGQAPVKSAALPPPPPSAPEEPVPSPAEPGELTPQAVPEPEPEPQPAPVAPTTQAEPAATEGQGQGQGRLSTMPARPPIPRIRMGKIVTPGGDEAEPLVTRALRSQLGGIRVCYEQALKRAPKLEGTFTLRARFERDGSVSSVEVEKREGDASDAALARCAGQALSRAKIEAREHDPLLVIVPLMFASGR